MTRQRLMAIVAAAALLSGSTGLTACAKSGAKHVNREVKQGARNVKKGVNKLKQDLEGNNGGNNNKGY